MLTAAVNPSGAVTYRWRKDGVNLFNTPVYSGVNTPTLTINSTDPTQTGQYVLVATNICGSSSSEPAGVVFRCVADFNRDNAADFFDYLDFVAALETEDPAADLNRDGVVDFFDYLDFVGALDLGC